VDAASLAIAWRWVALAGFAGGLAAAPLLAMVPADGRAGVAVASAAILALAAVRPRVRGGPSASGLRSSAIAWLAALGASSLLAGAAVGELRLEAIDAGAYRGRTGAEVSVRGFVAAVPHRSDGQVSVRVQTGTGRLLVTAPEPVPDLPIGREVSAAGVVREPEEWEASYLERMGVVSVVEADRIRLTGARRGGLGALVDSVRDRGEAALERGTPPPEAALVRGFVLGEDDRIDPGTVDDFQRSGLAHLLAVSGQNVLLLALLANPILALAGVPLRARLLCVLALIAVYVPVTGAGPSIQRAGVMGGAGVIAALAGRPSARWYALLLAAGVTLALNPRATGDVGWQLSFAAVVGIAAWASGLRDVFARGLTSERGAAARDDRPAGRGSEIREALADGAAVTLAATLATAPLMAYHFEAVSLAAIPANLLALPAVAPVMWLGMLTAAAGQLPPLPVEPLSGLAALFAAYVAQVAHAFAAPGWAQVDVHLAGPGSVAIAYALLAAALGTIIAVSRRRGGLRPGTPRPRRRPLRLLVLALVAAVVGAGLLAATGSLGSATPSRQRAGLVVTVLDVGQGDAILLRPRGGDAILVDGGPPGDALSTRLDELGVSALGAAVLTHDQADHIGGVEEALGELPIARLAYARLGGSLLRRARLAGARPVRLATGSEIRSGDLHLEALWPPPALLDVPAQDPNERSLVLLARWHRFRMLLTGDAESELAPVDPGRLDVLKVAHHGSEDEGLDGLLARSAPRLAVVSVGEDNPYGLPAPETLAELAQRGVPLLRTDLDGDVSIQVRRSGWRSYSAEPNGEATGWWGSIGGLIRAPP
jgi:competence protein ComEC